MEIGSRVFRTLGKYESSFALTIGRAAQKNVRSASLAHACSRRVTAQTTLGYYKSGVLYVQFAALPKLLYVSLFRVAPGSIVVVLGIRKLLIVEGAQKGRSTWQARAYSTT